MIISKEIESIGNAHSSIDGYVNTFNTEIYSTAENRNLAISAKNKAQSWVDDLESNFEKSKVLIISSHSVGSGKTKLANAIFNDLINFNKIVSGIYQTELKIFEACKFGRINKEETLEKLDNIFVAPLLIIDDFMSTSASEVFSKMYEVILNYRNSNNKFTILISMYSKKALVNQFSEEPVIKKFVMSADEIELPAENIDMLLSKMVNFRLQKLFYKQSTNC